MHLILLSLKSIANRKYTIAITTLSIALSIMLLLGVERLRVQAHEGFANTISGTDLIVGARSGSVQLLLYSVFRIGNPTNSISWTSYQEIRQHPMVEWSIPLSLGDSHRGYRVLGTNGDYFRHYRYGRQQPLAFASGGPFSDRHDAVLGAEVARELGYGLDQSIVISHGTGEVSFIEHDDQPFRVVGILQPTGTPVDRTLHVSLQGIEAIHAGWTGGAPPRGAAQQLAELSRGADAEPATISAALLGLKSRLGVFRVQRYVNEYRAEPLSAALPGVALQELWDTIGIAQRALLGVSALVVLVGVSGMAAAMLTSLEERRRELAVLRALGARPWQIFTLLLSEAAAIMTLAISLGLGLLYLLQLALQPLLQAQLGIHLAMTAPSAYELALLGLAMASGLLVGVLPAYRAYRHSLADGMTIRV